MPLPLLPDTVLQNRYRLLNLLAQGGFAQTYLAEDQGRFKERCVVKAFCPPSDDPMVFEKAKELFQREAQTLYRLTHPQVPRFRALFTEDMGQAQRLFLVQDYVAGQTYRTLLEQRVQQHQTFSESEIRQLLHQLLPVLAYVHQQGIIHRDLSLDNLILRASDHLPVLIDFGVVKTVVTQLQRTNVMPTGTAVGKFGYAPVEQIQSGRAYPNSDLYSLAVCCAVLLTGLEPAQLFDDQSATWNWRSHTAVSEALAAILDRMLAHKPSDRYSSADEVLKALQADPTLAAQDSPSSQSPNKGKTVSPPQNPAPSQMRTIAVADGAALQDSRPRSQKAVIPPVRQVKAPVARSTASRPVPPKSRMGALLFVGLIAALLAVGAGWLLMQVLMLHPWSKTPISTTPTTPPTVESPSPRPSASLRYSQSLDLAAGQTVTVQDTLQPGETQPYRFEAAAGDRLTAQLTGDGLVFHVVQADLAPVNQASRNRRQWQGTLPNADIYYVQVQNASNAPAQSFQLTLGLSRPTPEPSVSPPSPSVSLTPPVVEPTVTETALALGVETPPQQLSSQLAAAQIQRYTVTAEAGQSLSAAVIGNQAVTLTIRNPSGQPLSSAETVLTWESLLSESGTYQIDVVPIDSTKPIDFVIEVGLKQPQN
jgi:serine/threonine-protein kinase